MILLFDEPCEQVKAILRVLILSIFWSVASSLWCCTLMFPFCSADLAGASWWSLVLAVFLWWEILGLIICRLFGYNMGGNFWLFLYLPYLSWVVNICGISCIVLSFLRISSTSVSHCVVLFAACLYLCIIGWFWNLMFLNGDIDILHP